MLASNSRLVGFAVPVLLVAVVIVVAVLLHVLFSRSISDLTVEILAAIIAVVLVVASVAVTIHYQSKSETEREFRVELFKQKVELYKEVLVCIASADDDGHITDGEIESIRNLSRTAALYADEALIDALADFLQRLSKERKLYLPDVNGGNGGTLRAVVQAMRKDLAVVGEEDEDVTASIGRLVSKSESRPGETNDGAVT